MSNKKTRQRQLSKLAQRRAAERRRQRRKRIVAGVVAFAVAAGGGTIAFLAFTGNKSTTKPSASPTPVAGGVACGAKVPAAAGKEKKVFKNAPPMTIDKTKTYTATMVTSCGTITLRLDAKEAPNTVNSLVFLANEHFFDGLKFHRIVKNFVIQGGDPSGNGSGGPGYSTVDPPPKGVKYREGDLAMAKTQADPPGTSGSQFFIVTGDPAALNASPVYALVGKVVQGLDVAKKIEQLPAAGGAADGAPAEAVYVETFTVQES